MPGKERIEEYKRAGSYYISGEQYDILWSDSRGGWRMSLSAKGLRSCLELDKTDRELDELGCEQVLREFDLSGKYKLEQVKCLSPLELEKLRQEPQMKYVDFPGRCYWYVEDELEYENKKVSYISGETDIFTCCDGSPGKLSFINVRGYALDSGFEPIASREEQKGIREALQTRHNISNIHFLTIGI